MNEYVVAKYLRLSLEDADLDISEKDESNSISNQRKLVDSVISEKFAGREIKILEFIDDGKSGTTFERPGVTELLNLAKQGKINCIIVKDFSRWGRNYIAVGDYLEQIFPFLQIRFISVNDDYDSEMLQYGSAGMVDVGFKNIMHDLYSKELSQKLKLTKQQLFAAGKYHSSFAFYGYWKSSKNKYRLTIDNETANIVRKIFKWTERGMKTTQIAKKLNDKKVPTPMMFLSRQKSFKWYLKEENHGKMWTSSSVLRILRDERYTGKCIYGRTKVAAIGSKRLVKQPEDQWIVVPGALPAIISQERFDRVQPKLKKHVKSTNNKTARLFSGNIRCGHCGYALAYYPAHYPYYQCHNHVTSDTTCCGNRILEKELSDAVLTMAKKYATIIIEKQTEVDIRLKDIQSKRTNLHNKILQLRKEEAKLLSENNELFELLIDGKLNDTDYRKQTAANTDRVLYLREKTKILSSEENELLPETDNKSERKLLKRLLSLEHLDKALVDCLVKSVDVFSGGKIHVIWKFSCFCDTINSQESQDVIDEVNSEISNRVWLYYCSAGGWEKLNQTRQLVSDCASRMGLSVIGESFDNARLSITATGFKEMQRAVRQGRVDKVIVPSLEGVSKTTGAYAALERVIRKRKVQLYDKHGNLIIG